MKRRFSLFWDVTLGVPVRNLHLLLLHLPGQGLFLAPCVWFIGGDSRCSLGDSPSGQLLDAMYAISLQVLRNLGDQDEARPGLCSSGVQSPLWRETRAMVLPGIMRYLVWLEPREAGAVPALARGYTGPGRWGSGLGWAGAVVCDLSFKRRTGCRLGRKQQESGPHVGSWRHA